MIVFGTNLYGRIEAEQPTRSLEGIGTSIQVTIATQFVHVMFIPLIPLKSYLFLNPEDESVGMDIGFHWKSILLGYLRVWSVLLAVFFFLRTRGHLALLPSLLNNMLLVGMVLLGLCTWMWFGKRKKHTTKSVALKFVLPMLIVSGIAVTNVQRAKSLELDNSNRDRVVKLLNQFGVERGDRHRFDRNR